mmetsp:Transcript_23247/g.75162  ORF Transcript_23247/g.75162 Transcript_23247/m.75162 type:complete len:262 (+) Transcript_23247:349-1134(+)
MKSRSARRTARLYRIVKRPQLTMSKLLVELEFTNTVPKSNAVSRGSGSTTASTAKVSDLTATLPASCHSRRPSASRTLSNKLKLKLAGRDARKLMRTSLSSPTAKVPSLGPREGAAAGRAAGAGGQALGQVGGAAGCARQPHLEQPTDLRGHEGQRRGRHGLSGHAPGVAGRVGGGSVCQIPGREAEAAAAPVLDCGEGLHNILSRHGLGGAQQAELEVQPRKQAAYRATPNSKPRGTELLADPLEGPWQRQEGEQARHSL